MAHSVVAGDPSLRLKDGYAQDDAIDERRCHQKFKLTHYRGGVLLASRRDVLYLQAKPFSGFRVITQPMEQPCYKCGQLVEEGRPFCPHCGAPQIRVVLTGAPLDFVSRAQEPGLAQPAGPDVESDVALGVPTRVIKWPQAFIAAATAGAVAGLGMTLIGLFGLWMIAAGLLSVHFYRRRTQGDLLGPGAGARVGALSGSLGFTLFCLITVPTGFFRVMITEMVGRYAQRSDPRVQALTQSWVDQLKTPSGLAVWLICMFLFMVLASAAGGALGGVLLGRKPRS